MSREWSRGSEWHRWDPHIHTPGTLFEDKFKAGWDEYFTAIEQAMPRVSALGITDYCVLSSYKEFCSRQAEGRRAPNVAFIFPNIEFRLTIETERKKGVNLHLLFSPEDPNHQNEIERILGNFRFEYRHRKYACTPADLRRLGRATQQAQMDDRGALRKGAQQFKLNIEDLKEALRSDEWLADNCLVAVSSNTEDGTAGLGRDSAFQAQREELESLADVIFSAQESDRSFWLGKKEGFLPEYIESTYGGLKPCLHGCDAHSLDRVLKPDQDRFCWIKAELGFAGLKQTLFEPDTRVTIGKEPPPSASQSESVDRLEISEAPWLAKRNIGLNNGLVAIIGPKGSGKTALADMIAHAANAEISGSSSFLLKAQKVLGGASSHLVWRDGTTTEEKQLATAHSEEEDDSLVRYLSQHFVEQLCSGEHIQDKLVLEIENVVFQATPDEDRLEATSFAELRQTSLSHISRLREAYLSDIRDLSRKIAEEEAKQAELPTKRRELGNTERELESLQKEIKILLPRGKRTETERLATIQQAIEARTGAIEGRRLRVARLDALREEYEQMKVRTMRHFLSLKQEYKDCGITDDEWQKLAPIFPVNPEAELTSAKQRLEDRIKELEVPRRRRDEELASRPLADLRTKASVLSKKVGIEERRARKYRAVVKKLGEMKRQKSKLESLIKDSEEAVERRRAAIEARRSSYASVFEALTREEEVLEHLYMPLKTQLEAEPGEEKQLEFYVQRYVDARTWVEKGEALIDSRTGGAFQGKGTLKERIEESLLPAWQTGGAQEIADAMVEFLERYGRDLARQKGERVTLHELGDWLFSTDHISIDYGIRFAGVEIARLSPGTRGVVLLMLYLAVDEWDTRPLVVDQPEENLDPQSVFELLVPYFRSAKQRRQVILVTHNPNLVVNADADQVIVAMSERKDSTNLPDITYTSGGLENPQTRKDVCRILEGGERAFLEREWRYNLRRHRFAAASALESRELPGQQKRPR